MHQLFEVNTIDLGEQRVLDGLGHLGARSTIEQTGVTEQLGGAVIGERQRLAVARDLADLDSSAVDEEQRATRIARQIDDVASSRFAQLDTLGHARDRIGAEVRKQRDLAQIPEDALRVGHESTVASDRNCGLVAVLTKVPP